MFDNYKLLTSRTVGFDNFFDHLDQLLNDVNHSVKAQGFPPYNIYYEDDRNKYTLEFAVAGFTRDNLSVSLDVQSGVQQLTISGNKDHRDAEDEGGRTYLVQGLAARKFTRTLSLAENIRVEDVSLSDGVLTIKLTRIETKPDTKLLTIN